MIKLKYKILIVGSDLETRAHVSKKGSRRYKSIEHIWKYNSFSLRSAFAALAQLIKHGDLTAEIQFFDMETDEVLFSTGKITLPTLYKDKAELENIK